MNQNSELAPDFVPAHVYLLLLHNIFAYFSTYYIQRMLSLLCYLFKLCPLLFFLALPIRAFSLINHVCCY